ncbi:peptidase propeptide and ypeb domain-containing protein [Streptococcus massiliensis]|uniref:Peptidase propeptide and ypeb domain-containing protein n=2 Tax=Streptococcus massiliensis TaxID=313439 RepID=A0A380KXT1_9STRE|nr:peptidase propeptide and ypeb domain-containing protein [Streptococcus massiliensis]
MGSALLLLSLIISLGVIVYLAQLPYAAARQEITRIAGKEAGIKTIESIDFFNAKESYTSLIGKNVKGHEKAVLLDKKQQQVYIYDLKQGLSQKEAEKIAHTKGVKQIDKVTFGRLNDKPVWEVKSGVHYYIVNFEKAITSKEEE